MSEMALTAIEKAFAPSFALLEKEPCFCIYGAGKNGMLIYCILAGPNVTVDEIYDDAQKGRLGSHKIRTYDDAETKDPVFVAISENNPVTASITRKIVESERIALSI